MGNRPNLRAIVFWMRSYIYTALILTLVVLIAYLIDSQFNIWNGLVVNNAEAAKLVLGVAWALALLPTFLFCSLKWVTTVHSVSEKQFFFSRGILNRKKYVVNYENIQNINVDRSLVETLLGLSTIRIQTAGSKPWESEIELEGIGSGETERFVRGITRLVENTRGEKEKVRVSISGAASNEQDIQELKETVQRLEAELREIRGLLGEQKRRKE